jgi:hypothetical protein
MEMEDDKAVRANNDVDDSGKEGDLVPLSDMNDDLFTDPTHSNASNIR